jgi:hypothetical protein
MRSVIALLVQRVHRSGHLLANTVSSLIDAKNYSFELLVPSFLLAVVSDVKRAVFIGHVAGWRGHNPMLADPGVLDVRTVGEALRVGSLYGGFADNRLSVWRHVREGVLGNRHVALLYDAFSTRPRLGLRQYRRQHNEQWNQVVARS